MTNLSRLLLLVAALQLTGCVATDLSQLNTSYEVLIQRRDNPPTPKQSTTPGEVTQPASEISQDTDAAFRALALDAQKTAKEAKGPTKANALRLGAVSAWLGGDDNLSETIRLEGVDACKSLTEKSGAPRDCAILAYLHVIRENRALARRMNAIQQRTPQGMQEMLALLKNLETVGNSAGPALSEIFAGQKQYFGVSASTLGYFKDVTTSTACLVKWANLFGYGEPVEGSQAVIDRSAAVAREPYQRIMVNLGVVDAQNVNWMAVTNCPGR